jgi:hypothetical protein
MITAMLRAGQKPHKKAQIITAFVITGRDLEDPDCLGQRMKRVKGDHIQTKQNRKFTNPRIKTSNNKIPRLDLSLERAEWVTGCPPPLPGRIFVVK